jgi:alpha-tubulin suppressor-like RCC1 family protein
MKTLKYLGIAARGLVVSVPLLRALHGIALAGSLLVLASCGGGGGGSGGGNGGPGATLPAPLQGTITGLSRVVTNQNYTYTGVAASGAASNYSWAWGDGSTGSTNASSSTQTKIWRAAGNYTASLSFIDSTNNTASVTQAVAVIDHPISSGAQHSCAILSDNTVACWGQNNAGQLGNSANVDTNIPVVVPGLNNVISLTAHGYGTCVAKTDGSVWCWGGYGFTNTPQQVAGITNVVALASTWEHVCALQRAGTVKCFGNTSQGALGDGVIFHNQADPAVQASNLTDAVSIAAGGSHTCAIKADQTVVCWGNGALGAVGPSTSAIATTPVAVAGVNNAISLALGEYLSCAVITDGTVMCWGNAGSSLAATFARGQGITGNTITTATPQVMPGLNNVVSMSIGRYHACVLKSNNTVDCWGTIGGGTKQLTPVAVMTSATETLKNVQAIGSGWGQTCAIKFNGAAFCWGSNSNGQLGNATTLNNTIAQPILMSAFSTANIVKSAISLGYDHRCALKTNGDVACWGRNYIGQLGNGTNSIGNTEVFPYTAPSVVNIPGGATAIAAGYNSTCALKTNGNVACWGQGALGELGDGASTNSNTPVSVNIPGGATAISSSSGGAYCVLLTTGNIACWGRNFDGNFGNGTNTSSAVPTAVNILGGVTAISTGIDHTCAIKTNGDLSCWGSNSSGALGDGTNTNNYVAGSINIPGVFTAVSASGAGHTCAIKANSDLLCWGANYYGQLGNGTNANSNTPVLVNIAGGVSAVSVDIGHTCVVKKVDGTVACWGGGNYGAHSGEIGNGTHVNTNIPVNVSSAESFDTVSTGKNSTCAIKANSDVWCWGFFWMATVINNGNTNVPVNITPALPLIDPTQLTFWK